MTWKDIDWVRERWPGPLVLKGVLDAEDARDARSCGVEGLVVSNHGGRQLDGTPSAIAALPPVVQALGGRLPVLLDGGVRRGTDVLKALCLGASAVLIGRPYLYALAVGGADAVRGMLALLRDEIALSMSLLGAGRLSELSPDLLTRT